ncbi:STAS domain-containing protein [Amycolatopsis sp. NPDC089917]|uniref:STAS domain-containing protein n=1 Tax=Amycolatopsis sp. NPDC089917 TaxID=3155187 RepID=UPI0034459622
MSCMILSRAETSATLITVTGELDAAYVPAFATTLAAADEHLPVILDLVHATFCSAAAAGLIHTAHHHRLGYQQRLILATDAYAVLLPLHLLGLDNDLDIVATVADARTTLGLPVCPPLDNPPSTSYADQP